MGVDHCDLPENYDINIYTFFHGIPTRVLTGKDEIDIGRRIMEVLHMPGRSPGHMCFWEKERDYLFTGDMVYKDTLFAYYPFTDSVAYLNSIEKIAEFLVKGVFLSHHSLDIDPEILGRMGDEFRKLKKEENFITAAVRLSMGIGQFHYRTFLNIRIIKEEKLLNLYKEK